MIPPRSSIVLVALLVVALPLDSADGQSRAPTRPVPNSKPKRPPPGTAQTSKKLKPPKNCRCVCFIHGPGTSTDDFKPKPPPTLADYARTEVTYPRRWSWLHWWEAHREDYLEPAPPSLGGTSATPAEAPSDLREKAVAALIDALGAPGWQARTEAALALGRMGEASAVPELAKLLTQERNKEVRQAAMNSLAMIGGPEAEEALMAIRGRSGTVGALTAMSASTQPSDRARASLEEIVRAKDPDAAVASGRALRNDAENVRVDLFREILARTRHPLLAIEAILGLGEIGDPADVRLLSSILLAAPRVGDEVPGWRALENSRDQRLRAAGEHVANNRRALERGDRHTIMRQREELAYQQVRAGTPGPGGLEPYYGDLWFNIPVGQEEIFLGHMRAAAAVALGGMKDKTATRVLVQALLQDGSEWTRLGSDPNAIARLYEFSDLHKGMAIMSLARTQGDATMLDVLIDVMHGHISNTAGHNAERMKGSPLRGYAALALGIYARAVEGEPAPDEASAARGCRALEQRMMDRRETTEVRTAAALGLGVARRAENLAALRTIDPLKEPDMAVAGHLLLARAMLADPDVPNLASELLKRKRTATMSDALGRRAAVLAMGVNGTPEVVLKIKETWEQPSYDAAQESARALALARAYEVTDDLIRMLEDGKATGLGGFAAKALGQLFAQEGGDPLANLVRDSAYTLAENGEDSARLAGMANEFLGRIIPSFDVASR